VIETFKRRKISLWLLDLGGDVSGNGVSELIVTILAATAQFERTLISERICDAKRQLRRQGRHQGGDRPFGWRLGEANGAGRARELVPDEGEQAAIADIIAMRQAGRSLMTIRDAMRAAGHGISHQTVANLLARHAAETANGSA
jgi:DNA invertase Pin-like site-specific DNA recombinase